MAASASGRYRDGRASYDLVGTPHRLDESDPDGLPQQAGPRLPVRGGAARPGARPAGEIRFLDDVAGGPLGFHRGMSRPRVLIVATPYVSATALAVCLSLDDTCEVVVPDVATAAVAPGQPGRGVAVSSMLAGAPSEGHGAARSHPGLLRPVRARAGRAASRPRCP